MICPKCGRNIEGNLCPYCDEPQIDDNTDEYLKKKREYEKSLRSFDEEETDAPEDRKTEGGRRIKAKTVVIILAVIAAALITALITTHLPKTYHGRVYAVSGGQVTDAAAGREDNTGRIFSSEGKDVYAHLQEPESIKNLYGAQLKTYYASEGGGYFALTAYEEDYSLYVWDKKGNVAGVLNQSDAISVKDVTDSGEIIYSSSPVLNDQWYMGDTSLHIYKARGAEGGALTGETRKLCENVQSFLIYENAKTVICLDKNGTLFSCPDYNVENRRVIAENVTRLLGENGDEDNYFTPDAPCVNVYNSADLIAYLQDGIWTMSDTQGRISLTLGAAGDNARFIYDDSDRMIYRTEGSVLSKSIVTDRGLREWVNVTASAGEALIWDGSKHSLICETEDGLLLRVSASETATVAEGVAEGSLRRVLNSGGYLYRGSDGIYVSADLKGKPRLTSGGEITGDINRCAENKGTIYIHAGNDLYAVEHMEFINELGDCEGLYVVGK